MSNRSNISARNRPNGAGEFSRGWPVVVAGLFANVIFSLPPYTSGIFMKSLQNAFGWSRTDISLSVTILSLGIAVGAVLVGFVCRRVDPRLLIGGGILVYAAGFWKLSALSGNLTEFWVVAAATAIFGAACSPITVSRLVVDFFDTHRGTALGMTMMGSGLASTLAPLVLVPIVTRYGWQFGYESVSIAILALGPVILGLLFLPSRRTAIEPRAAVSTQTEALDRPLLARLFLAFFFVSLAVGGAIVHFVPMMTDARFTPAATAELASLIGISVIVGRLLTGVVIDRWCAPRVAAIATASGAAGFLLIARTGIAGLPYIPIVTGLSVGAELDLIAFLVSRYFARSSYGPIFSIVFFAFQGGLALSPIYYAAIHDARQSYGPALVVSALALMASAVLFATLPAIWPGQRSRMELQENPM